MSLPTPAFYGQTNMFHGFSGIIMEAVVRKGVQDSKFITI
jgi:hypothetical protein